MMLEIDSNSVPRNDWSRFQCVVWIKCFLEDRLNWDSERAMAFSIRFREAGSVMVRMGRGDWVDMVGEGRYVAGIASICARIDEFERLGLVEEFW